MLIKTIATFTTLFKPSSKLVNKLWKNNRLVSMRPSIKFYFSTENKPNSSDQSNSQQHQKTEHKQKEDQDQDPKETQTEQKQEKQVLDPSQQNVEQKGFGASAWNYLKNSWRHTFPDQEYQVKRLQEQRKQSIKQTAQRAKIAKQEEEAAAIAAAEAEVESKAAAAEEQELNKSSLVNIIDEKEEERFKRRKESKKSNIMSGSTKKWGVDGGFKNIGESATSVGYFWSSVNDGAKAGDSKISKGTQNLLQLVSSSQTISKASEEMRKIDYKFETTELEVEAKYLFVSTYNDFLKGNYDSFEKVCSEKGYEFFKTQRNIIKARNIRPYSLNLIDPQPVTLVDAVAISENSCPSFTFRINAQDIYCYYDNKDGKIVEGDPSRVQSVMFQFTIRYSESQMKALGHPWEIIDVVKLSEVSMLY